MSKINIADIEDQFINGKDTNLLGFHPIPLGDIEVDFSDLSQEGVTDFKKMIVNIIVGSKELRPSTKPDPIAAMLMNVDRSMNDPRVNAEEYARFEATRVADKWRGNRIGELNELICCLQPNMKKSDSGRLDIQVLDGCNKVIAIAEVKNRFNTMNAASAIRTRKTMETVVLDKTSSYYGCDAILVERIPKKNGEITDFNPSDPSRGQKGSETNKIRRMGLHQFLSVYGEAKHVYAKAVVLMAFTLREQGVLPNDYDLRFIFNLMHESLS
ncbi:Eco47II family restriction endonuclease [Enterovibrio sp. ZSDZ35]|uniref:Eco47II family restriction endonuclease n=1 Tax=Enterovibrio qingdaonensis TaxID=2899818 RepID=A0ABT5QT10_9GAMM|nr:Eco47II family restriction endonuclease [Enterovibrio sp. ZSDZ35]MDD1784120.1 Eco47II family restriction endonuclease [Enterovibrio sp. ZSDZ35]